MPHPPNATGDGAYSYTWDAESQMKSAAGVTYAYDAQGRRVSKSTGKNYIYGLGGDVLAETDGAGNTTAEYVFFGGKRIAMLPASGNPIYYIEDMLGTSRVITQNNGVVCYDADFYPYGGERAYTNTCPQNYKFEGKERSLLLSASVPSPKSSGIRTYEKRARNPFRIRTSKSLDLKSFRIRTYRKHPGGGPLASLSLPPYLLASLLPCLLALCFRLH